MRTFWGVICSREAMILAAAAMIVWPVSALYGMAVASITAGVILLVSQYFEDLRGMP